MHLIEECLLDIEQRVEGLRRPSGVRALGRRA